MTSDEQFRVENTNHVRDGDVIQQFGAGSIGKQVHTGAGDNVLHKNGPVSPETVVVQDGDYVAQDKTTSHRGNVRHHVGQRPDAHEAARPEDEQ
ncbi:hypothetical protein [Amycolatopsis sp. H20-H5]|uniref:hypothetical protein n=1 Tax=Amycolatopsis sp. H20-H5 TaxID=3046309 RepID=UPI002DB57666|nr:hypothetical protein [Amycolatopsis sp. H20-H5]MEC3982391.1 hypothetical protein [Amycolatopsis sp. H20-H5]